MSDTLDETPDEVSEAECRRLLGTQTFGRVGITSGGLPRILPVSYSYDDGWVVFRTGTEAPLRTASSGDVLVFEVDSYDPQSGQGWTVQVLGRASVVTTEHEYAGLSSLDGGDGDGRSDDDRNRCMSLHCDLISGRIIHALQPF